MVVYRKNRASRHQRVDEVGFSHKTDHAVRPLLPENTLESIDPSDEVSHPRENRVPLDREVHRNQPALEWICLPLMKYDQHNFTQSEIER